MITPSATPSPVKSPNGLAAAATSAFARLVFTCKNACRGGSVVAHASFDALPTVPYSFTPSTV